MSISSTHRAGAVRHAAGPAVAATVAIAWTLTLAVTGSPLFDVIQWIAAVAVGVLLPGAVVVRASRPTPAPLIEDAAWAAAAGCLVALLGWLLDRTLPFSPGPLVVGPFVATVGLAVPAARRRILARPAPGWGIRPTLALAAVILVSLAWMSVTALNAYRVDPGAGGTTYYPDIVYQLDLVGELRHAVVPTYPPVAGTSLSYHWFLYAIDAHLLEHTGVDPFDSMIRLAPATLVPAVLVLVAVVARRMSGLVWAGPLAAALLGVVDISAATRWSVQDGTIGVMQYFWWLSPSQTLGWLAGAATAGCLFAFVRKAPHDRAVPTVLLIPFLALTAGSKSSELPVIVAGVALATAVQLLRRDWATARRCGAALGLGLAVFLTASRTIYGGSSYGVRAELWGAMYQRAMAMFPSQVMRHGELYLTPPRVPLLVLITTSVLFLVPLLPRLLGLIFVVRMRSADPTGWICVGAAAAGLIAPFLVRHPGGSEVYFLLSAYPIGVIGSASGLAIAFGRIRVALAASSQRHLLPAAAATLVLMGAVVAALAANLQPHLDPVTRWVKVADDPTVSGVSEVSMVLRWVTPTAVLLFTLATLSVAVAMSVGRGVGSFRFVAAFVMVSLLVGAGVFGATLRFAGTDARPPSAASAVRLPFPRPAQGPTPPSVITRDEIAAGRWVDAHAGADDIVATNLYCLTRPVRIAAPCDARSFAASALTQRRTLVGGWAYADRIQASAWNLKVPYRDAPFWHPDLLIREQIALRHPTAERMRALYHEDDVRWLFVDRRDSHIKVAALDRVAARMFTGPTTAVWKLRPNS